MKSLLAAFAISILLFENYSCPPFSGTKKIVDESEFSDPKLYAEKLCKSYNQQFRRTKRFLEDSYHPKRLKICDSLTPVGLESRNSKEIVADRLCSAVLKAKNVSPYGGVKDAECDRTTKLRCGESGNVYGPRSTGVCFLRKNDRSLGRLYISNGPTKNIYFVGFADLKIKPSIVNITGYLTLNSPFFDKVEANFAFPEGFGQKEN